jgi:hypothetical protein
MAAEKNVLGKGGQHLRYPARTPMSNLLLTMLDKAGVPGCRYRPRRVALYLDRYFACRQHCDLRSDAPSLILSLV